MIIEMNSGDPLVMLIDESATDNKVNTKMLMHYGFSQRVSVFNNTKDALSYLRAATANEQDHSRVPCIIFVSCKLFLNKEMPFMKAYNELPKELKLKCKIVMLSGFADAGTAVKERSIFMQLNKPLIGRDVESLASSMRAYAQAV